jgi:hypothetical protein
LSIAGFDPTACVFVPQGGAVLVSIATASNELVNSLHGSLLYSEYNCGLKFKLTKEFGLCKENSRKQDRY